MNIVIFDLDNCIANDLWRHPLIKHDAPLETRWDDFNSQCLMDKFCNRDIVVSHRRQGHNIIVSTARPDSKRVQSDTKMWLRRNGVRPLRLFMRPHQSYMTSVDIKRTNLNQIRSLFPAAKIVAAYDDRDDVIAMYKEEGLNAIKLAIHDEDAEKSL